MTTIALQRASRAERRKQRTTTTATPPPPTGSGRLVVAVALYARIVRARLAVGLTQAEVEGACRPPLPATSMSRYERAGGPTPNDQRLREIARVLRVELHRLARGDGLDVAPASPPGGRVAVYRNGAGRPMVSTE